MSCYNAKPPNPPREWSRVQNRCVYDTNTNTNFFLQKKLLADMQYKGNILQYKKNSSNYTKNQIYSLIGQGKWLLRNKTYATQSETYTNPNTNYLRRINGQFIDLNTGQNVPQPNCKNPQPIIFPVLPNVIPVVSPPPLPPPKPSQPQTFPITTNIVIISTDIIEDNGVLICSQQENPCTGEIKTTFQGDHCYSTTFSDVPRGKINTLCYQTEPLYYPKTRLTMNNSTDKWPYGSKFIRPSYNIIPRPILQLTSNLKRK